MLFRDFMHQVGGGRGTSSWGGGGKWDQGKGVGGKWDQVGGGDA